MFKKDALEQIKKHFFSETNKNSAAEAELMLKFFTDVLKMKPPTLPEDHCQALTSIYIDGHSYNQWEEDFMKDEKATRELFKIQARKRNSKS